MSATNQIFLIGPGYIGLEVIDRLLDQNYHVTALVRRKEATRDLENRGIKTVQGTLSDADTIERHVEASDIIFHTATADDLPSVEAVLRGIERCASHDKHTIYIHTSGCSLLSDDSRGEYASDVIYSDKTPDQIDKRPDSASHHLIDLAILKARQELGMKAKIFIMLPPLIYGATQNGRLSIQMITMARFATKHQYAGFVGRGKSVWGTVHVSNLSRGYMTMLQWLLSSPADVALDHPYFFCENGQEVTWRQAAEMIGEGLHSAGRLPDPKPREIPEDQYDDLFGPYSMVVLGQNARNKANRLRQLGWQPREKDIKQTFMEEELPVLLKETGKFKGYAGVAASGSG